jgi:archaellum component FlaC
VLINDINSYKKELIAKEQEIMDLRRSIEALDANVDDLQ